MSSDLGLLNHSRWLPVIPHISQRYQTDIPQITHRYHTDIPKISNRYQTDIKQISHRYPRDITQISNKYPTDITKISHSHSQISRIVWSDNVWRFTSTLLLVEDKGRPSGSLALWGLCRSGYSRSQNLKVYWCWWHFLSSQRNLYKLCYCLIHILGNILLANWTAKWSVRVDSGLVTICTCRGLLKTAKYPSIDYLCSFTVEHTV